MKEYWINVYPNHILGFRHWSREDILETTRIINIPILYRIHVRLK